MRKGRTILAAILLVALAVTPVLASGSAEKAGVSDGSVNLRFSWWGNDVRHKATIEVIDKYMAENPGVTISAEYRGQSQREMIATQLAGGTVADIVQLNPPWMGDFTADGNRFFEEITQYGDVLDISGFDPQFLADNGTYNGELIGLPTGVNARTAIINRTLAEQFGIPTSLDTKWTWKDFHDIGMTVHQQDPEKYFFNADTVDMTEFVLLPYLVQRTGNQLIQDDYTRGFTTENLVEVLTYIASLYADGVVVPIQEGNVFLNSVWTNPDWLQGNIVCEFSWTSLYSAVTSDMAPGNEMGVFILPVLEDAKNTGLIITPSQLLCISSASKNKEEAAKFLNYFFNNPEAGLILGDVRSVPPVDSIQQLCEEEGLIDAEIIKATQYAQENQGLYRNALSGNSEIVKVLNDAVEKVAYDSSAVESAAAEAVDMIDYILAEMN